MASEPKKDAWAPPVSFYFNVQFEGDIEVPFQEVSGLSLEIETETIKEGGENSYSYQVPVRRKHGNLVLKRSLMPISEWLESYIVGVLESNGSEEIQCVMVNVSLLDPGGEALESWLLLNVYPVKWSVSEFGAQKNELAIEQLELAYTNLIRM